MSKKRRIGPCSVFGCGLPIDTLTWCNSHYIRNWKFGSPIPRHAGNKRNHPYYAIWFDKKRAGALSDEWLDIFQFAKDIGQRPGPDFILRRLRVKEKYSAANFEWRRVLQKRTDETKKEWYARKWASRVNEFPELNLQHSLKKRFGIDRSDFDKMLVRQNGVCAICKEPERGHHWSGEPKRLSIDHCHATKRVRELLCFRCNSTLGKVGESLELLDAMKEYISRHKADPAPCAPTAKRKAAAP